MELPPARDATLPTDPASPDGGPPFPVVGLGASAGGLQALSQFFTYTPPDTGIAFAVVCHLAPDHYSRLAELLQNHTAMPVTQVRELVKLKPNHVYVIPPARLLVMVDSTLRLVEPLREEDRIAPIDHFFRTLADAHDSRGVAIILSGAGSDGAIGIKRVKEAGGVVLVQDPQEAEFDGMPRAAIASGLADFVLPIAAMPDTLISLRGRSAMLQPIDDDPANTDGREALLREVFAILRLRTGHDFSLYKRPTVFRRLARRLQVTGAADMEAYVALLRNRPDEVQALLQDLLISVTNFFRDRTAWESLESLVPQLFANRLPDENVRTWVVGCATGEEAYSLAMLLLEHAETLDQMPAIQIFATDIDEDALVVARQGLYPETIAADVSPTRLQRFFNSESGGYRIKREVRDLVIFARHNVLRDAPFSRLGLITCRNLLIYFNQAAQDHVLRVFHFSLRPEGYLLLGSAESGDGGANLFGSIDKTQRVFQRRAGSLTLPSAISIPSLPQPIRQAAPTSREQSTGIASFGQLHQQLMNPYTPPSVIVNREGVIVHLSRTVGRFLYFGEGELSANLLKVVHPDLRVELRRALFMAIQQGRRADVQRVPVTMDGVSRLVDIVVQPILEPEWATGHVLVVFNDMGEVTAAVATHEPSDAAGVVQQLEVELERIRDQLRVTVEQYEAVVEEYEASNEELQAINEELRAASEELETSKEELQSLNEELTTLNQEFQIKIHELDRANNDLQNLIASTQIGTIFLDRELRIKRYTPSARAIFNLIPSDIQRPIDHITHTLRYEQLIPDAREVLDTLTTLTREVESTAGHWYLVRLLPYRTIEDRIAGVVVTFVDITDRKQAEEALRESEERYRNLFNSMDEAFALQEMMTDAAGNGVDFRYLEVNPAFEKQSGLVNPVGRSIRELLPHIEPLWIERFAEVVRTGESVRFQSRVAELDRWFDVFVSHVGGPGSQRIAVLFTNITARTRAEEALRESETRLRRAIEIETVGIIFFKPDGNITGSNDAFLRMSGYSRDELANALVRWDRLTPPEWMPQSVRAIEEFRTMGRTTPYEKEYFRKDGSRWWALFAATRLVDDEGVEFILDITERKQAEVERERLLHEAERARAEAEAAVGVRDQFLSIASHELRTPLTSLMGYAHMLQQNLAEREVDEPTQRMAAITVSQAKRLNTLIDQMLDATRLQRGQFAIEPRPMDLAAFIRQVVDDFALTLSKKDGKHTVDLTLPNGSVLVKIDPDRLEAVLLNLLANAVKYSPAGGPVTVHITRQEREAMVEVTDQGIGIPAEAEPLLFVPFYRANNVNARISGFGIGLYVVREIVERHGGRVEVSSTEGQGSTFRVILPLLEPAS